MSLPYEGATSGEKALHDLQKILTSFGCQRFGYMTDNVVGEVIVQFNYKGRDVIVKASTKGYAAAYLVENPWSNARRIDKPKWEAKALAQAQVSVCSILRDWIKGQITAIEVGMLTFEGAFLGQILLPNGKTVLEQAQKNNFLALEQK